jgi:DNA polymerase-3 subunit delta
MKYTDLEAFFDIQRIPQKFIVLYGDDNHFLKQSVNILTQQFVKIGATIVNMYSSEVDLPQIIDEVLTTSFFVSKKMVVVYSDQKFFKNHFTDLLRISSNIPDKTLLIFVIDSMLEFQTQQTDNFVAINCVKPIGKKFAEFVESIIHKEQKTIEPRALSLLLQRTGENLSLILQGINKLVLYCVEKNMITTSDVLTVIPYEVEFEIFNLVDAVSAGNVRDAIKILKCLISYGEQPTEIVARLIWLYRKITEAKKLAYEISDFSRLCDEIGIKYYRWRFQDAVNRYSLKDLVRKIRLLLKADLKLKTYSIYGQEEPILQDLVIKLAKTNK